MSFNDEYLKLRKKRLEEEETRRDNTNQNKVYLDTLFPDASSDIAPVRQTTTEKTDERKWFQKGAFADSDDGFWEALGKTIVGSVTDIGENLGAGIIGMGEKAVDALATIAPIFAQGQYYQNGGGYNIEQDKIFNETIEKSKSELQKFVEKDLYNEEEIAKKIISDPVKNVTGIDAELDSVLGEKSDALVQSGGQLLGTAALQVAGVPWWLTTGATSFGAEAESAFQQGATYDEAAFSAAVSAGAEILTEKISGGISFGGKTWDEGVTSFLAANISNKTVQALAKLGIDAVGEGGEEILSGVMSAIGQKLTYADDKEFNELFSSEEAFESFIGGLVLGGGSSVISGVKANKKGEDAVTGLAKDTEQKVVDKVFNDAVAEAEKDGKKLSAKEKTDLYNDVLNKLDKGYIDTDTIEEVLGEDVYKSYKDTIDYEDDILKQYEELGKKTNPTLSEMSLYDELKSQYNDIKQNSQREAIKSRLSEEVFGKVKDTKLAESYNEQARRGQHFEADLSQYDEKQQEVIKRAVESGILNNTNRTHEFVDLIAKISADKGVLFDFTNNAKLKESGFAIDGKEVNGFVTKDGISINIDSHKALQSTVGHEITHVLEGTELYAEMQRALFDYAKSKGDFDGRRQSLAELYKDIEGADVDAELAADLVGDYLFTDEDFVKHLSTQNRNVFQKIYDEIKHLWKLATAGSKEARELEKVKRAFDKAYKESGKASEGTKYSLGETTDGRFVAVVDSDILSNIDTTSWDKSKKAEAKKAASEALKKFSGGIVVDGITRKVNKQSRNEYTRSDYTEGLYNKDPDVFADKMRAADVADDIVVATTNWSRDGGLTHPRNDNFVDFDHGKTLIASGNAKYSAEVVVGITNDGEAVFYDVVDMTPTTFDIKKAKSPTAATTQNAIGDIHEDFVDDIIPQNPEKSSGFGKFSLSDSDGKQLTKGQQEYFKDSKMRDENGNLKVMYHGSQDAGFHVFDPAHSDDETSLFFVDRNDVAASYSGTTETYEAKTIRSAKDMNNFLAEIGYDHYEAVEKNGKFELLENNEHVAYSNTAQGLYEEFCWYEGVGDGDANYKVYLNLTNPLVVDAEGRNWNNITREYSQEVADRYNSLTAEEKAALSNLAEWGEYSIFKDEMLDARAAAEQGVSSGYGDVAFTKTLARAYQKLGGANANLYDAFSIASDNFSAESIQEFAVKQMNTRDYAQKAKAEGYDGVIFNNLVDVGGYGNGSEGASTVAIAFDSNQIKSVANEQPGKNADIRYSLSKADDDYISAVESGDMETAHRLVEDAANKAGYTIRAYHGTPNAEFTVFDKDRVGKGNDQYGAGFYFTTSKTGASHYGNRVIDAALNIKNPIRFRATAESGRNLIDADITLTSKQAYEVVKRLPGIYDAEESPLGDYYDAYWEVGAKDWMVRDLAEQYKDVGYLDSDLFRNYPNELHEALRDVVGFDGVEVTFESTGEKFYVAWFNNQIKSIDTVTHDDNGNVIPLSERFNAEKVDIRNSLSPEGAPQKRYGNYNIYGKDVRFEAPMQDEVAPMQETVSKTETVEDYAPDEFAPIPEAEANAMQSENIAHLDDADAPPEMEAPYYGETQDAAPIDPFEDRDMKEVSRDRKTPAYMYENPEVKPFFQAEANILLGELERVEKPETIYNGWAKYEMSYEFAQDIPEIYRTSRVASDTIVYLRDTIGMSYEDIEKGLNAIIEDNGAENIAAAKKLEFVLNDRLLYGYRDDAGFEIPANQDYINLLTEKQIAEYSEEARKQFFDVADAYAPQEDDIAPVAATTEEITEVPVKEQYEAIKPERKKSTEPRLKRVKDSETSADGKQRKWIGTSTDSEAVDGKVTPDDIPDDMRYYQPIPNKVTLGNANTRLDSMGYDASLSYFNSQFANKRVSLDDIALGERLIQEAVKRGDTKTASELIQNVSILGTELGQKVQALSIIKRLSPEGQLRMLQKTVERGKTRGDKSFEGVEITQEMIDHILKTYGKDGTYDQTKLNEAVEDVKKKIAKQMKVTKLEKVNAWRYLSMLGNPKTHIRNLVSNVAMQGTVAVKNAVARTIETVAPIENRTKTWKRASDAVKTFSQNTAMEMKDVLSDGGKYSEEASIKANRDTFKNKVLNKVYNFNSDMLSKEDWWFSKPAFTNALSEYLTANGIETEQDIANNPKIVAKAKQYATEQSQIATFRQYSWLANKINEIERKNAVTNIAVGAVLPFKKTPINIAKTGLNYSPLGFAKTLTYDAAQVKNGKMEASELVDHLSQNITGSALTLVGYLLASSGFLNGAGEDDKEGKYDYQLGEQAYSVTIGDATYSLSWLSPIAMPLFVGANAYEQLVEGKEWNGDVVVQTLAQTLDPLSEMSFLSSLDSVLSSYDSGIMKFAGIAQTAVQSYTSQFVPTLSSQVAAVMDDTKRTTKVAGDSTFKAFDEIINNLKYKIPGLRETLEPTTDIWGNEVKQTEDMLTRAFETFIAPYSKREDIATEIDSEIKSLYGMTGDDGLIPSIPNNYVNYKDEKYKMSAKEYTAYKEAYGQTAYNLLGELFDTETYRYASDEDKAEMVNKVYDYARDVAKQEFLAKKGVTYTNAKEDGEDIYREDNIKGAIEHDMTLDEYTFYHEYPEKYALAKSVGGYEKYKTYSSDLYDIKADKDENGKSIVGSRKDKVADYINGLDISYEEKIILFKSEYNADDTYNYEIIDYLNNREDISYDEMMSILRELGFTVKGDTITWD